MKSFLERRRSLSVPRALKHDAGQGLVLERFDDMDGWLVEDVVRKMKEVPLYDHADPDDYDWFLREPILPFTLGYAPIRERERIVFLNVDDGGRVPTIKYDGDTGVFVPGTSLKKGFQWWSAWGLVAVRPSRKPSVP